MTKHTLKDDFNRFKRAVKLWRGYAPKYWSAAIIQRVIQTVLSYFSLTMSALILDEISGKRDLKRLIILAALTVLGEFTLSLISRISKAQTDIIDSQSYYRYSQIMFDASCRLQYDYLENPDIALMYEKIDVNTRTIYGGLMGVLYIVPNIVDSLTELFLSLSLTAAALFASTSGQFSGILRFINSPLSALAMLLFIAAFSALTAKLTSVRRGRENDARSEVSLTSRRYSAYGALWGTDMSVFGLHSIVLEEYRKYTLKPSWLLKLQRINLTFGLINAPKNAVMQLLVHIYVAAKAFIGAFGIGSFVLYESAISRFVDAIQNLSESVAELRFHSKYLQLTYEYFDLPNNMYKGTLAVEKRDDIDYEIEFKDVSFKYPRTEVWALRHVSMKFKIGDKIAIVGENGSGKTTFIKLLCRLYDPTEGKILLNGIDITRYRYSEYLELFSVVFQDFNLFGFSIGDNVSADVGYDEGRARDCLIRAGMGKKIMLLEKNSDSGKKALDYCIGREYSLEGIDLSGGEQQKIALSRALYKDAPFVILDEPTASLDPIAEAAVYENFNSISKNRTSVFISHRLSSCRFCNRILVFDKGCIVQEGNHDSLLKKEGKYQSLWEAQAKYYVTKNSKK